MTVTNEMISAAHKVTMEHGDIVLSHRLLTKIYLSMDALANREKTSGSPIQDYEAVAADQAMTIALMKAEQEPVAWIYTPTVGDGPKERRLTFVSPSEWGTQLGLEVIPLYTKLLQHDVVPKRHIAYVCPQCHWTLSASFFNN